MQLKKAVILVAGRGTRMMPLTLHQPKALLNVTDRPVIHYLIDELITGGLREFVIIRSSHQKDIETYLRYAQKNDWQSLNLKFKFAIQKQQTGSANALLAAQRLVGNTPFVLYFCDDLLVDQTSPTINLIKAFQAVKGNGSMLVLQRFPQEKSRSYAVIKPKKISKDLYQALAITEKPEPEKADSDLGAIGRYILLPDIFKAIKSAIPLHRGKKEVAVSDILQNYIAAGNKVYGLVFHGQLFDTGSKMGLMKAQAYFGLRHAEFGKPLKNFLRELFSKD